ncbi:ABC multidrug transporter [Melanomma pulvis-pyrius CBS 109.77]|uniref:ABC multidrug transporter n=1 Tax=Melanomma pulvis-pyrius CBS 109.77 TaxID=1314802 RepID=A0A6A6WUQ5_9PLEO|nr:ABC multidrug transporter [Melanomma pulvis-pyrius CBS 109.77]
MSLAIAFSLSIVAFTVTLPADAGLLAYMLFLAIVRLICGEGPARTRCYHHVNLLAVVATMLSALQVLLPSILLMSRPTSSITDSVKLFFEAATAFVAFIKPRPHQRKDRTAGDDENKEETRPSPEETCSWLSYYCSYEWLTYLIFRGCRRDLCMNDLPPLPDYDAPLLWLERMMTQRLRRGKTFITLCRVLKADIKVMIFWSLATSITEYIAPFAMYRLLGFLENPRDVIVHPFLWITLLLGGPMARSISYQQYIFTSTRLLVRVDVLLIQEIYQTALRSYQFSEQDNHMEKGAETSNRRDMTTLVSYDVDAIDSARDIFYVATAGTLSTLIAMIFLYHMLGWPSTIGVLTLVLLTPLPALLSRRMSHIQQTVLRATDARISTISEYLHSIRTVKYLGWETAVEKKVNDIRAIEQKRLWKRNFHSATISLAGDLLPLVTLLVMFSVFVLFTNQPLRAPAAFTSLTIVETLRSQFVWLSNVSRWAAQGIESLRRVDHFLESAVELKRHPAGPPMFNNATFRRTPAADFKLQNLSITFREKTLNVVTGHTGSGKSSLLLSLLGETILEVGSASCPSDVAYVPQTAWLQNDSIRQNILFYSPFNKARYDSVIDACALLPDFRTFPSGDQTHVGEQGSSLSGGQRQRISLARAIYSCSETLLLDDVFSALDTHTTNLVYERCFQSDLLVGRTVILVTNLPAAIQDASLIISMQHGAVEEVIEAKKQLKISLKVAIEEMESRKDLASQVTAIPEEGQESGNVPSEHIFLLQNSPQQIQMEFTAEGRIPRTLVWKYLLLFGGIPHALLAIISALVVQIAFFSITYWLSVWTSSSPKDNSAVETSSHNPIFYLSIYCGTVLIFLALQFTNNLIYQAGGWRAARTLHTRMLSSLLHAPLSFYTFNPIGRCLNRFGLDTQSLDTVLVDWLRQTLDNGLRFFLRILGVASIMPIFAVPAAVICSLGFAVGEMYTRAQVSVKRLCAVSYSPIVTHFGDTLAGLSIIRARTAHPGIFQSILASYVAERTRACEAQYNLNRWVSVRSDLCAAAVSMAAGAVALWKSDSSVSPGLIGFSLANAIGLSQTILTLVRNMNELEVEMNSFQRVSEYADIVPEDASDGRRLNLDSERVLPPSAGKIEFRNVTAKYTEAGRPVLSDLTLSIRSGTRLAVVGRTGSGKSTLALSLLRFTQLSKGRITIDDISIQDINLQTLRRDLVTMIPQDAILFEGSIRENLDPFGSHSDAELQIALDACSSISTSLPDTTNQLLRLGTIIHPHGANLSHGQCQILSLARALVRRSKIMLLDESTASVDIATEARMQDIMDKQFRGRTVVAICHRLRGVVGGFFDQVLVLGNGEVMELGTPLELIAKKGLFWDMLEATGERDELVKVAEEATALVAKTVDSNG